MSDLKEENLKRAYEEFRIRNNYMGKRMEEKGYGYAEKAYAESQDLPMPQILSYLESPSAKIRKRHED